ncbi:MAG: hypothetical protein Q8J62_08685 [Candidatus Cloacimonadaceae bacterium]|nr:hypothetical protein [Candidatus Cloacimonadaceae bacterium]
MNKNMPILGILLVALMLIGSCAKKQDDTDATVQNFSVLDMPFDDGTGVMLKWKPLDKSKRVIQYNIYRGHNPDSLFLLSKIEVDPKLGVIGNELYFFDRDYQPLIEFEKAPGKLKKEKHQAPDSPLYLAVPLDPIVLKNLLPHYTVLGAISKNNFYYRGKKVLQGEDVLAGYKLNQFDYIFANPIPGKEYYYSIVAVNERGRHFSGSEIKSVAPYDNRPDSTAVLHTTYLEDTQEFGFEFSPPSGSQDIAQYSAWLMPKSMIPLYHNEQLKNLHAPDSVFNAAWQNGSIHLFDLPNHSNTPFSYHKVNAREAGIGTLQNVGDYLPVFSYVDYSGFETASLGNSLRIRTSDMLPKVPEFKIKDKMNDKGDNLLVSIGHPIAYISQAAYANSQKTRLRVNYELAENESYKIDQIKFTFYDKSGVKHLEVIEHFVDKTFRINIPIALKNVAEFKVESVIKIRGTRAWSNDVLKQNVFYDNITRRFNAKNIRLNSMPLTGLYYDVFTRSKLSADFAPGLRSNAMIRSYDHAISYESTLYKVLKGFDDATKRITIDPSFIVAVDNEKEAVFRASLFRDEFEKNLKDSESADFITKHPAYKEASAKKSERAWLKTLWRESQLNARSFAYQLLVTDGKGMHSQSNTFTHPDGSIWNYPVSEWFDNTKYATLLGSLLFCFLLLFSIYNSRRKELFIRPIAGLEELDNAVGRATEMGRPVMFVPGWGSLGEPCTIAAMMILNQIARKTAEYDIRLISPHLDYFVVPLAQEMVRTAYSEAGRQDAYNQNDIFYVSDAQFAFSAAVNGITVRERVATIFYMGYFNAEALLMTETGNQAGSIQIAGTDAITQVPFFITTCDYTLIGEEFYAASAYLSRNMELISMLKGQDYFKLVIVISVVVGAILSSMHFNLLINFLPFE